MVISHPDKISAKEISLGRLDRLGRRMNTGPPVSLAPVCHARRERARCTRIKGIFLIFGASFPSNLLNFSISQHQKKGFLSFLHLSIALSGEREHNLCISVVIRLQQTTYNLQQTAHGSPCKSVQSACSVAPINLYAFGGWYWGVQKLKLKPTGKS